MDELWSRRPRESVRAYMAFMEYLKLPPKVRTINKAFRVSSGHHLDDSQIVAPHHWFHWAGRFQWAERVTAYDMSVIEQDLEKWEERRARARERDWEQAEALRAIVDEALPTANRFYRRTVSQPQGGTPRVINQEGQVVQEGTPAQVVVTVAFNVTDMSKILMDASKLQRLVLDEPTDNINNLSGAALNTALERALGQWALENLADDGEAGYAPLAIEEDPGEAEGYFDGGSEDGME